MAHVLGIEATTAHEYLVRLGEDGNTVETRVRVTPGVLSQLNAPEVDERAIVEHTIAFLVCRQLAVDLPSALDLDDVAAGYDDYLPDMVSLLKQRS